MASDFDDILAQHALDGALPTSGSTARGGLADAPAHAPVLLRALMELDADDPRLEPALRLLSATLDEARMARENGQKRGVRLIEALEEQLETMAAMGQLNLHARHLAARVWVSVGLTAPACLAIDPLADEEAIEALKDIQAADGFAEMFDRTFGPMLSECDNNAWIAHTMFAELLPTLPAAAGLAIVAHAAAQPEPVFGELGCIWCLDQDESIRVSAIEGLRCRLDRGLLDTELHRRLLLLRSWLPAGHSRDQLDSLLRDVIRAGAAEPAAVLPVKIHRIVASMIDGTGAQSFAAAVQRGGTRHLAVLLVKPGYGVKDAFAVPCSSATEQRNLIGEYVTNAGSVDVSLDYLAAAAAIALGENKSLKRPPAPGLLDVAQHCGLIELRPVSATLDEVIALADPEGSVAALSGQALGRLIKQSVHWPMRHEMLDSWFEDDDGTVEALEAARSDAGLARTMYKVLEGRRDHWAMIVARTAAFLRACGKEGVDEFAAVARGLANGRGLKTIPVMEHIADLSIEVWMERTGGRHGSGMASPPEGPLDFERPNSPLPVDGIAPARKGEIEQFLARRGIPIVWLDGYLAGVCLAPSHVPSVYWIRSPIVMVADVLKGRNEMARFVDLLMLRYNAMLDLLIETNGAGISPPNAKDILAWAEGFLTAWDSNEEGWPAPSTIGKSGIVLRLALEAAAEETVKDAAVFARDIADWAVPRIQLLRLAQRYKPPSGQR